VLVLAQSLVDYGLLQSVTANVQALFSSIRDQVGDIPVSWWIGVVAAMVVALWFRRSRRGG
jgi:ribose/xylose/arabinose/galactoside ABC-type transport system permease subunit